MTTPAPWGECIRSSRLASAAAPLEEYQLDRVEVGRLHPTLIECAAIGWTAPKEALDCAVRMCGGLHQTVVPIIELEIE